MPDAAGSFALETRKPVPELRLAAVARAMKPGAFRPAPDEVEPLLADEVIRIRQLACVLLGQIGAAAVPALILALDVKQPLSVRSIAASGLAQAGPEATSGAEALGKCLESSDEILRSNAALALSRMGASGLPSLRRGLTAEISAAASARGIAQLGVLGAPAEHDLARLAATRKGGSTRLAALAALVAVTNDPARGLPDLMDLARDPEAATRAEAIERIGELRARARRAIPALRISLEDMSPNVRAAAALALARVGSVEPETEAALIRRLSDPVGEVRVFAIVALERFGPSAASALPALRRLESGLDKRVAAVAELAIRSIELRPAPGEGAPPGSVRR